MKKYIFLGGILLAGTSVVLVALYFHLLEQQRARSRRIDREHYDRIQLGMRRDEVEAILGSPPGDYEVDGWHSYGGNYNGLVWTGREECWIGDEGEIEVGVDDKGVAHMKQFLVAYPMEPPPWGQRMRAWLR